MLIKKNRVWAVVALLAAVTGFSSCLKNDSNVTPTRPQAQNRFMNLSTSTVPATFYDNDVKVSDSIIDFNFYSRYAVYGGAHKFELRKQGGDSVIVNNISTYDSTGYYTFLMYDNPVKAIAIPTSTENYDQTKIGIRFLNLSPDAGPVDVYIGSEKIDSNRTYMSTGELMSASTFKLFSSFSINNTVTIKAAGTDDVLANSTDLPVTSFTQGNFYTIYLAGLKAHPSGSDKLLVNAFYSLY
jgi:hypothetical protein